MSFTYNSDLEKPLLQNVLGIKKLDIKGKQLQSLTLKGKFITNNKNLNQKLSILDKINIDFPFATSRLIISPKNYNLSSKQDLSILEIRINPKTRINQLTYNQENKLSFCLQSATQPSEYCLFPDNVDNDPNFSNSESLGNLKLSLGKQLYIIDLEQVNIPELNITSDQNRYQSFQLNYIPKTREPQLNILSPTEIVIDLPELTPNKSNPEIKIRPNLDVEIKPNLEIEIPQWFYEDLDVTDVEFYRFKPFYYSNKKLRVSTIINGKISMNNQDLKLEPKQLLIVIDNNPGIRKLLYLSINPLKPQGLQTFISGKSKGLATGLSTEFPIESIQPSWLSKYFSTEAIAGIISFISAFTAVVLEKILFPDNP
ncbi:MAG: hypothetical protein QNJ55_36250 [Xenococcus sp. MO_188.B8]|nr:hypothetical protein [Xenococcus sp. MO_188.B8]